MGASDKQVRLDWIRCATVPILLPLSGIQSSHIRHTVFQLIWKLETFLLLYTTLLRWSMPYVICNHAEG